MVQDKSFKNEQPVQNSKLNKALLEEGIVPEDFPDLFPIDTQRICVAFPAFNEAFYLGSLILQTRQYIDQVIVVDDGSSDDSAIIARLAGAIVIQHEQNQGKGAAIKTILSEARKMNIDTLVLADADMQHNPNEIPRLIAPVITGKADLVIGCRTIEQCQTRTYRRLGRFVLLHATKLLARQRSITDSESGFRALSGKAISGFELKENGFAIESEMISEAARKDMKITEVPISNIYTDDGSTTNPITHGVGVLSRILVMVSERRPLFFFTLLGGILLVSGVVMGVWVIDHVNETGKLRTGTALIVALSVIIGIFCIFTGIMLNALKRIEKNQKY